MMASASVALVSTAIQIVGTLYSHRRNALPDHDSLVQTRVRTECRLGVAAVNVGKSQAASAAFHNSDRGDIRIPSLPVLNWRFLIFSANSIPLMVIAALSNRLNPSIGRIRCFTRR